MATKFGDYLRKLRDKQQYKLRDVEEYAGISNSYLAQLENGERGVPTFKILKRLADLYGIRVSKLIEAAEGETSSNSISSNSLTGEQRWLLEAYKGLSKENKTYLQNTLTHLLRSEGNPEPFTTSKKASLQPSTRTGKVTSA